MRQEAPRRRWNGWVIGLLILIPLLWVGYWYTVQRIASGAIERATTQPIGGGSFTCADKSLGGFPLSIDFACPSANFARGSAGSPDNIAATIGGLTASAPLYWPGYVETRLDSPLRVNAPALGVALTAAWSAASSTVSAGVGGLQGFGADFHSLDFVNGGDTTRLPLKSVKATVANFDIAPAGGNAYKLGFLTEGLTIVPANGRNIPTVDGEVRLTALEFGSSLGNDPGGAVLNWLRTSGSADIERLRVASGGAVVDAAGKLTLGPDGLLNGQLTVRFRNIEALARLAETIQPGSGPQVAQALAILSAVTVPVNLPDGPARETTLNLRKSVISVGIIPVATIPPLRF